MEARVMGFAFAACSGKVKSGIPKQTCVGATTGNRFPMQVVRTCGRCLASALWLAAIACGPVCGAAHAAGPGHHDEAAAAAIFDQSLREASDATLLAELRRQVVSYPTR